MRKKRIEGDGKRINSLVVCFLRVLGSFREVVFVILDSVRKVFKGIGVFFGVKKIDKFNVNSKGYYFLIIRVKNKFVIYVCL